jgi:hypothetical protein
MTEQRYNPALLKRYRKEVKRERLAAEGQGERDVLLARWRLGEITEEEYRNAIEDSFADEQEQLEKPEMMVPAGPARQRRRAMKYYCPRIL